MDYEYAYAVGYVFT